MKKTNIGKGLVILLLISICTFGFRSFEKADVAKPVKTKTQITYLAINPEDMVQGGYYYYWDHGSGAQVAQFDRYDNSTGTIYNTYAIAPQQGLFLQNSSISLYDAGNITVALLGDVLHLLRCILAGLYVL